MEGQQIIILILYAVFVVFASMLAHRLRKTRRRVGGKAKDIMLKVAEAEGITVLELSDEMTAISMKDSDEVEKTTFAESKINYRDPKNAARLLEFLIENNAARLGGNGEIELSVNGDEFVVRGSNKDEFYITVMLSYLFAIGGSEALDDV